MQAKGGIEKDHWGSENCSYQCQQSRTHMRLYLQEFALQFEEGQLLQCIGMARTSEPLTIN